MKVDKLNGADTSDMIAADSADGNPVTKKKSRALRIVLDILFFIVLIVLVAGVYIYSSNNSGPKPILGYSCFTVLSTSMQRDMPQGSLIIVKYVDTNTIEVGDDITFFVASNVTRTHRVVNIYENYGDAGERGFVTKGTENAAVDKDVVPAVNVVGAVILTFPYLGAVMQYISTNILRVLGILAMLVLLYYLLRFIFGSGSKNSV